MDFGTYLRFIVVLILVIGLILGLAWMMKRFGLSSDLQGTLGRKRRLSIIESVSLDGRHRAVLMRRDGVEHLVLVGQNTSQVIERGIPSLLPETEADPVPPPETQAFSQFLPTDKET